MKNLVRLILLAVIALALAACAALQAAAVDDPYQQLQLAAELFDNQTRPIPAEKLIATAVATFQKNNDEIGLAEAYRYYGYFMRSNAIVLWAKHYREKGFLDKKATYDKRIERGIEYFKKARDLYEKNKQFGRVANLYLNLAFAYNMLEDLDATCAAFDMSYLSYTQSIKITPQSRLVVPRKYRNYAGYIAAEKQRLKCP